MSLPPWLRTWGADSGALLFSQVAAVAATTALAVLVARELGPREWGIFSGFLGLALGLSFLAEFGVGTWLLRELSRVGNPAAPEDASAGAEAARLVAGGFGLTAALGSAFVVSTAAAAVVLQLDLPLAVAVVSLVGYSALLSACSSIEAFFRSRRNLGRVIAATLLEKGVLLGLVVLTVASGGGIGAIALAYPIAGLVRLIFVLVNVLARAEIRFSAPKFAEARHVLSHSTPFALNRVSLNVVPRFDALFLALLSPVAAGYFALGDRIVGPALIVPVVMSTALYPFLARERDDRAGWQVIGLLTAAGIVIAGIGILAAPFVVPVVFGAGFEDAVPVVQVMLGVIPFVFASNPLLAHVYSSRRERRGLAVTLGIVAVVGTGVIVGGQALIGPLAAGAGYVLRQALFVASLAVAALLPARATSWPEGEAVGALSSTASEGVS